MILINSAWLINAQRVCRVYPLPGSNQVIPGVTVQVQFDADRSEAEVLNNLNIQVSGHHPDMETSGHKKRNYQGEVKWLNNNTLIFKPAQPFLEGDSIRFRMHDRTNPANNLDHHFLIRKKVVSARPERATTVPDPPADNTLKAAHHENRPRLINGVAVPADFPEIIPAVNKETAPGYIFMSNRNGPPYITIFENDGTPYFYRRVVERSMDFKMQPAGVLSRRLRERSWGFGILDTNYQFVRSWNAQGYPTDEHDMQLTPEGTAWLIGIDYRYMDLSDTVPGGRNNVKVMGTLIQEIDADTNVLFEWNGWDHFYITDAEHEALSNNFVDFIHTNSVAVDYDGHVVISSRHQNECTKINRQTGEVMWRLGGKHSDFTFTDGDSISYQHDFRPVPGKPDHYTLFDNGNHKKPLPYSRAVEFRLDLDSMKAHTVWEYRHSPDRYSHWMGNVQRLPNGNTIIGWADAPLPKITEVTPEGIVVYEADYAGNSNCYRAFRFEWDGVLPRPELIVEKSVDQLSLIYQKFGDTALTGYNIYADTLPDPTHLLATTEENYINLDDSLLRLDVDYYFRVRAVYADGSESLPSDELAVFTDLLQKGENLVRNGDFTDKLDSWILSLEDSAGADLEVPESDQFAMKIYEGGSDYSSVRLFQTGIPLIKGTEYIFEFDASSSIPMTINARIMKGVKPWTNYARNGLTHIAENLKTYIYEFEMNDPSDFNSWLVFDCGSIDSTTLLLNNISVKEKTDSPDSLGNIDTATSMSKSGRDRDHLLLYPNPARDMVAIRLNRPVAGQLVLAVFDTLGRQVRTIVLRPRTGYSLLFREDISDLKEGIYAVTLSKNGKIIDRQLLEVY